MRRCRRVAPVCSCIGRSSVGSGGGRRCRGWRGRRRVSGYRANLDTFGDGVAVTTRAGGVLLVLVDGKATPAPAPGFRRFRLDLGGTHGGSVRDEVDGAAIVTAGCDDAGLLVLRRDGLHAEGGCRCGLEMHA